MGLSAEHLNIAVQIDTRICELERAGNNGVTIFAEMGPLMPSFKQLTDAVGQHGMEELCARFDGFYRYAKILENVVLGI